MFVVHSCQNVQGYVITFRCHFWHFFQPFIEVDFFVLHCHVGPAFNIPVIVIDPTNHKITYLISELAAVFAEQIKQVIWVVKKCSFDKFDKTPVPLQLQLRQFSYFCVSLLLADLGLFSLHSGWEVSLLCSSA